MRANKLYSAIIAIYFLVLGYPLLFAQPTSIIKGSVTNACGEPLIGVPVHYTGTSSGQVITDENGRYFIEVDSGGIYDLQPVVIDNLQNGVDTNDLTILQEHFINIDSEPISPYQILAADVTRSGGITTYDLVIINKIILDIPVSVSEPYWLFIDSAYIFPDPTNPWFENIPTNFSVNALEDTICRSFVGIKLGDVDCSANTDLTPPQTGMISGKVFKDNDENCDVDDNEPGIEGFILRFENGTETYYATTDQEGVYSIDLEPGNFTVSLLLPNGLWLACENDFAVSLEAFEQIVRHIGLQPLLDEPFMEVDISANFLRRCTSNYYIVRYSNSGPAIAENASVIVQFDDLMMPSSSTIPYTEDVELPNTYHFNIGNVPSLESGSFGITVELSCDAELGQTHCVDARILPSPSLPAGPDWDGSSLKVSGSCFPEGVKFIIENVGDNMEEAVPYIVIEDDLIMISGQTRLDSGEKMEVLVAGNGTTKRLEVEQSPGHPGSSRTSLSIEACGLNEEGGFSLGYIMPFPESDAEPDISISCQENIGPFDPNDKRAFPKGVGENHFIEANTSLDYQIRFQNVGTDTAFNVVIKDTLPTAVNPATFQAGASSHSYRYEISEAGILHITFEDIHLPDSSTNEAASQGFINFRVNQKPDNPVGTIIENKAAIYFDFNEPVITNYSWHTIGEGYIVADSVEIRGNVKTMSGIPIKDAIVHLHPLDLSTSTDSSGNYIFSNVPTSASYNLTLDYDSAPNAGVTTLDLILIHRNILLVAPFTSPYQHIAADLNNSENISALDMIITRYFILGEIDDWPNWVNWQFVPADFTFSNPDYPWANPIPETILIDNLIHPVQADFIGIKKGDVNGSFGN